MQEQLSGVKSELLLAVAASAKAQDHAQKVQLSLTTQLEEIENAKQILQDTAASTSAESAEKMHLLEGIVEDCGQEIVRLETQVAGLTRECQQGHDDVDMLGHELEQKDQVGIRQGTGVGIC